MNKMIYRMLILVALPLLPLLHMIFSLWMERANWVGSMKADYINFWASFKKGRRLESSEFRVSVAP